MLHQQDRYVVSSKRYNSTWLHVHACVCVCGCLSIQLHAVSCVGVYMYKQWSRSAAWLIPVSFPCPLSGWSDLFFLELVLLGLGRVSYKDCHMVLTIVSQTRAHLALDSFLVSWRRGGETKSCLLLSCLIVTGWMPYILKMCVRLNSLYVWSLTPYLKRESRGLSFSSSCLQSSQTILLQ